jgi:hypothetical protein
MRICTLISLGMKLEEGAGGQCSGQCPQSLSLKSWRGSSGGSCVCPDSSHAEVSSSMGIRYQPGVAKASQRRPEGWDIGVGLCQGEGLICYHLDSALSGGGRCGPPSSLFGFVGLFPGLRPCL